MMETGAVAGTPGPDGAFPQQCDEMPLSFNLTLETGQTTVKFSCDAAGRGGLVTSLGVSGDDATFLCREESFTSNGGDSVGSDGAAGGAVLGAREEESLHEASAVDDHFRTSDEGEAESVTQATVPPDGSDGSDSGSCAHARGEGYWERQCDPESGMMYYLNETVSMRGCAASWAWMNMPRVGHAVNLAACIAIADVG